MRLKVKSRIDYLHSAKNRELFFLRQFETLIHKQHPLRHLKEDLIIYYTERGRIQDLHLELLHIRNLYVWLHF